MIKHLKKRLFLTSRPKIAASANVIIEDNDGKLLVLKANYKKYWSLPGGWIDAGETPRQAAVRELREETGIEVDAEQLVLERVIERLSDITQTHLFVFRAVNINQRPDIKLQKSEIAEHDWVTRSQVLSGERNFNVTVRAWAKDEPSYLEHSL